MKKENPKKKKINFKDYGLLQRNIILFTLLFVGSVLLVYISTSKVYSELFLILSLLFGFVLMGLFIALLTIHFTKILKVKKIK